MYGIVVPKGVVMLLPLSLDVRSCFVLGEEIQTQVDTLSLQDSLW